MANSASTVYFELDARTTKFLAELNKAANAWDKTQRQMSGQSKAASDSITTANKQVSSSIDLVGKQANAASQVWGTAMRGMASAAAAAVAALGAREIIRYADTWIQTSNRLRIVSGSTDELAASQENLFAIAQTVAESYQSTVNVFAALTQGLAAAGTQSDKTALAVQALADAAEISGVDFTEVESRLVRMAQGLSDGTIGTSEFQTLLLTVPRALQALSAELNLPIDKLKELASEGKLGSKALVEALANQSGALRVEADNIVDEFSKIGNRINNELTRAIGTSLSAQFLTIARVGSDAFIDVIRTVEQLQSVFTVVGAVGVAAATAMSIAWSAFAASLTGIEAILVLIEIGYRKITGEKPFQSVANDIRSATTEASRLKDELLAAGKGGGNEEAIKRISGELAKATQELNRLDATGKLRAMIAQYDELQTRIVEANKNVFPGSKAVENSKARLNLIKQEIYGVEQQLNTLANNPRLEELEGKTAAQLRERLAALKGNKIRLEVEVVDAEKAVTQGVRPVVEEVRRLQAEAGQLRKDMSGLGLDINARGATTALGDAQSRLDDLIVSMREFTSGAKVLTPDEFIEKVKALSTELASVKSEVSGVVGGISGLQQAFSAFDPDAFKIGAGIGLARQRELERDATIEINRSILNGERGFSEELRAIMDATVAAKVGSDKILAQQSAASQGKVFDEKAFDEPTRKLNEFVQLFEQFGGRIEAGRNKISSGGSLITLGLGPEQFEEILTQTNEAQALIGENTIAANKAVNDAILQGKFVLGEELLQLAIEQATAEVNAAFEAKQAALGETGQAASLDEELENRAQSQERALKLASDLQSKLTAAEIKGVDVRKKLALSEAQIKMGLAQQVAGNAIQFLQAIGGQSKAAALAIIAIDKGLAIAQVIVQRQAAAAMITAQLGIYAGPALAANAAATAVSIGLIAATGLAQAATVGAGGGAEAGAAIAGTARGSEPPLQLGGFDPEGRNANNQVTININGDLVGWDEAMRDNLLNTIRDAVDGRDIILFSGNSRQAEEIRGGG